MFFYIISGLVLMALGALFLCSRIANHGEVFSEIFVGQFSIKDYETKAKMQNRLFYEFCFDLNGFKTEIRKFELLSKEEMTDIYIEIKICNVHQFPIYYFNSLCGYFVLINNMPDIHCFSTPVNKCKFNLVEQSKKAVYLRKIYNFKAFLSHNKDFISIHFDNDTVLHFPKEKLRTTS